MSNSIDMMGANKWLFDFTCGKQLVYVLVAKDQA